MKFSIKMLAMMAFITLFSACTQNNGDISPYFGYWRLDSIEIDGENDDDYDGNIVWSFQNNIIMITENNDHHDYDTHIGTWSESDGHLMLLFTHHDDVSGAGSFIPPSILGFPDDGIVDLVIEAQTSGAMTLSQTSDSGESYTYILSKVY